MMKKSERTKALILEKASAIFNVKGIAGTSIEDILLASKVARGCLYGHFENKDELVLASLNHLLQLKAGESSTVMERQTSAAGKIFAYLDIHKDTVNPTLSGGCPVMNFSTEVDDTNPLLAKLIRLDVTRTLKILTEILQNGVEQGELSERLVSAPFALKMFSAIKGALVITNLNGSASPIRTVIKELKQELNSYRIDPVLNLI
jgi:TetR/AcrR family transcriptional repressor of nem operon